MSLLCAIAINNIQSTHLTSFLFTDISRNTWHVYGAIIESYISPLQWLL